MDFRHMERSFATDLTSFQLVSISAGNSLNVLRQVLVGLPVFLLPPSGTTSDTVCVSDLLISVEYIQLISVIDL